MWYFRGAGGCKRAEPPRPFRAALTFVRRPPCLTEFLGPVGRSTVFYWLSSPLRVFMAHQPEYFIGSPAIWPIGSSILWALQPWPHALYSDGSSAEAFIGCPSLFPIRHSWRTKGIPCQAMGVPVGVFSRLFSPLPPGRLTLTTPLPCALGAAGPRRAAVALVGLGVHACST